MPNALPFSLKPCAAALLLALTTGMLVAAAPAAAQTTAAAAVRDYDLPAGPLAATLNRIAREAGLAFSTDAQLMQGRSAAPVRGRFEASEAMRRALAGSGLELLGTTGGGYTLRAAAQPAPGAAGSGAVLAPVTVTAQADSATGLPPVYAGGAVARGARAGVLGNLDFLDTPFNISAYTSETIENQQTTSIAEAVVNDPSVRVSGGNGALSDEFVIRGFPVDNKDATFNGLYGVLPAYRTSLEFVERIEISKGATAFLNGMAPIGSIGGNINIVPKRAGDDPLTRVTASYASKSQGALHLDVGRRFGEKKEFGIRANAVVRRGDKAIDYQKQEVDLGSLGLDYRGERLRLSADLISQSEDLHGIQHVLNVASGIVVPSAPDATHNLGQPWYVGNRRAQSAMVSGEFDLNAHWTAWLRAGQATTKNHVIGAGGGFTLLDASGNTRMLDSLVRFRYKTDSVDTGLRGQFATGAVHHRVSLGLTSYQQIASRYMDIKRTTPQFSNLYAPQVHAQPTFVDRAPWKEADIRLDSVSLSDTLSFMDERVLLTLGLRHQRVRTESFSYLTGQPTGTPYDEDALTPMVGLVVKPWEKVSLYGNYIEGLSQGETAPIDADNGGEVFAPYKSKQYEVGAKIDHGRLATTVSLFQLSKPTGGYLPGTNTYAQGNEQRNRGLEVNVFGELARGVRLHGGAMYNQARLVRTATGVNQGNTATGAPRLQLNLSGEWDVPQLPGLTLSAQAVRTSKQYVNAANTQSIPGWTRWDLGARYRTQIAGKATTLRMYVHNVTGKDYWAGTSIWGSGLYLGAPRTVSASLTVDF